MHSLILHNSLTVINWFPLQLIGLGTVGLGIWALLDDDKILILTEVGDTGSFDVASLIRTGALVLIASGGTAVLIGFFGCCGAVKENNCLLFAVS